MKLQLCRANGALCIALPLAIVSLCFFGQTLSRHYGVFNELQAVFLSESGILLASFSIWCGTFLFLTFSRRDWVLLSLLFVVLAVYVIGDTESSRGMDAVIFLVGMTLGKGASFLLKAETGKRESQNTILAIANRKSAIVNFLLGLVLLLAFAAWWHLEMKNHCYLGPRWMGLWDNPNIYGMLMGAGVVLSAGLLADRRWRMVDGIQKRSLFRFGAALKSVICHPLSAILFIATVMLGVGLVMSYSRGAWLGASIGLLYLAWCYGKLKWRHIVIGSSVLVLGAGVFWGRTPDSAPWYVKRADFGRPSAQNRATAWRAGLEIMRDHPLGVGWNNAVKIYGEKYHPPEGGPAAITTNDYMMIGTELGIPALLCFVAYVGLCYRHSPNLHLAPALSPPSRSGEGEALRAACLAGALVFVVAFWFDGGLFKLPTAAMFWVLLELGRISLAKS